MLGEPEVYEGVLQLHVEEVGAVKVDEYQHAVPVDQHVVGSQLAVDEAALGSGIDPIVEIDDQRAERAPTVGDLLHMGGHVLEVGEGMGEHDVLTPVGRCLPDETTRTCGAWLWLPCMSSSISRSRCRAGAASARAARHSSSSVAPSTA